MTLSLLCAAALFFGPLIGIGIGSIRRALEDPRIAVGCRIVPMAPQDGARWATTRPLGMWLEFPCPPEADCSNMYLPLVEDPAEPVPGLIGEMESEDLLTDAELRRLLPESRELRLRHVRAGRTTEIVVTAGPTARRRVSFRSERSEGDVTRGDFAWRECWSGAP